MSYSINITPGPVETFGERADAALEAATMPDEQREHAARAIEHVKELAASGHVGDAASHIGGFVSGHGVNDRPAGTPANESMSIGISEYTPST